MNPSSDGGEVQLDHLIFCKVENLKELAAFLDLPHEGIEHNRLAAKVFHEMKRLRAIDRVLKRKMK